MNTNTIKLSCTQHIVLELGACMPCSVGHLIGALRLQHDAGVDAYDVACALNLLIKSGYVELYDDAISWNLTDKGCEYLKTF